MQAVSRWLLPAVLAAVIAASMSAAASASLTANKPPNSSNYPGTCLRSPTVDGDLAKSSGLVGLIVLSGTKKIAGNEKTLPITIDGVPTKPAARNNCWVLVPMTHDKKPHNVCALSGKNGSTVSCAKTQMIKKWPAAVITVKIKKPASAVKVPANPKPPAAHPVPPPIAKAPPVKVTPKPVLSAAVTVYVKIMMDPAINCRTTTYVKFYPSGLPSKSFPSCVGHKITARLGTSICQGIQRPFVTADDLYHHCRVVTRDKQTEVFEQWVPAGETPPAPFRCTTSPEEGYSVHILLCTLGNSGVQWQARQDDPDSGWDIAPCHLVIDGVQSGNYAINYQQTGIKPGSKVSVSCKSANGGPGAENVAAIDLPH